MCGICGWILPEANPVDHLVKMNAAASHRGPDGEGYWVWDGGETTGLFIQPRAVPCHARTGARAAFGHRRLAILDLSAAGAQPMVSTDGKVWITFNGEIYNYVELQDELRRLG